MILRENGNITENSAARLHEFELTLARHMTTPEARGNELHNYVEPKEQELGWIEFFEQLERRKVSVSCDDNPTKKFLSDASSFAHKLNPKIIPPKLSIAEDGEVIIYWMGKGHYIEIDFFETDHFEFYGHDKKCSRKIDGVHKKVDNDIPSELMELLSNVSSRIVED